MSKVKGSGLQIRKPAPDPRPKRWWSKALSNEYKAGFEQIDWKQKPKKGKRKCIGA